MDLLLELVPKAISLLLVFPVTVWHLKKTSLSNCSVPNVNNNAAVWFEVYSKNAEGCFQEITPVIAEIESQ